MPRRTQRQVQVQNLIMFALQVKRKRAQIRLHHQLRLESLTGHEFNSSDDVLEDGDSVLTSCLDSDLDTSMSMSSDCLTFLTGTTSSSSASKSDTNEFLDSSVYLDPSSFSTVSGLASTDLDTGSESAVSHPDSGTEADDKLDDDDDIAGSSPTVMVEAQLGRLVREFIRDSY